MDNTTYFKGKLNRVYFNVGNFYGEQEPRFIKAPLDVLSLDGNTYIVPLTYGAAGNSKTGLSGVLLNDDSDALNVAQQGGWYDSKRDIMMESHQLGDWQGSDNWTSVNQFGLV